jgi:hypothetical protein
MTKGWRESDYVGNSGAVTAPTLYGCLVSTLHYNHEYITRRNGSLAIQGFQKANRPTLEAIQSKMRDAKLASWCCVVTFTVSRFNNIGPFRN